MFFSYKQANGLCISIRLQGKSSTTGMFHQHFATLNSYVHCGGPHIHGLHSYQSCSFHFQSNKMKVDVMGNERAMLGYLLAKIHKLDPDVIVVCKLVVHL